MSEEHDSEFWEQKRQEFYDSLDKKQKKQDESRELYLDLQEDSVRERYNKIEHAIDFLRDNDISAYIFAVDPPSEYDEQWNTWQVNNMTKLSKKDVNLCCLHNHVLVVSMIKHLYHNLTRSLRSEYPSADEQEYFEVFMEVFKSYLFARVEDSDFFQILKSKLEE